MPKILTGNNYGVEGVSSSNTELSDAKIWANMTQFSGESDSSWGNNAWSVQLNTNYFTGIYGDENWVQFVLQNNFHTWYGWHYSWFSIWTNDLTTGKYNRYTMSVPVITLSQSTKVFISGGVSGNVLFSQLDIYTSTGYTQYVLHENDPYGLAGKWYTVDGTILGIGAVPLPCLLPQRMK